MKNTTKQTKIANAPAKGGISKFAMIAVLVLSLFAGQRAGATIHYTSTLSTAANQAAAATDCGGQAQAAIYGFSLAISDNGGGSGTLPTITDVVLNTTNVATDVTRFQLWWSTTNSFAGATQLGSDLTTSLGSGNHDFSFSAETLNDNTTYYFWVTADISATAVHNNSIKTTAITKTSIVYGVAPWSTGGTATSGGNQTIHSLPTITGTPVARCGTGSVTLSATPSGGAVSWYTASTGGSSIATGTAYTTSSLSATTTTYYAQVTKDGCVGAARVAVTATVNAVPTAAPVATSICAGGTATLTANGANGTSTYMWSGSSLSATTAQNPTATPAVTSVYSLTVTNGTANAGCSSSYTATATVASIPAAAASNGGSICNGGTATLAATATGGTGTYTYSWTGAGLSANNIANPTAAPSATGTYSVTVSTTGSGCNSGIATTTVTVNADPTAVPANSGSICIGGTTNLSANATGGTGSYTYVWSGTNLSSTTVANPTVTPTTTTTYSVTVSNTGCAATTVYTTMVTVSSKPSAMPTTSAVMCSGGTASLAANAIGGIGSYSYVWSGANLSSTTVANPIATPTATATYTVTVSNTASGCSSASTVATTVNATPTAFSVIGGSYCQGGTVPHITLSGSTAGVSYQLFRNGTAIATMTGTGSALDFGSRSPGYTFTVTGANASTGCTNTMAGNATVTMLPAPTAYTMTGGGAFCSGGTGVHVGLSNSDAGMSYQLYNASTSTGSPLSGTGAAIDFGAQTAAGTCYYVIATNTTTGCTKSTTGSVGVTVNAAPYAFTVTGGGAYCAGGTGVAVGLSSTVGSTTYQLYKAPLAGSAPIGAAGSPVTGYGTTISFGSQTSAGVYSVVATNTVTGCTGSMAGTVVVSVNAAPSISDSTNIIAPSATISLSASIAGGTWASSNTAAATIGSAGDVTGVAVGTALISYTATTGCVATETINVTATGFKVAQQENSTTEVSNTTGIEVMVAPNPNNGTFTVRGSVASSDENVYVDVMNAAGQVVYQQSFTAANGQVDQQIQLNGSVANGMYLLSVRAKNASKVVRFAVAK